MSSKFKIANVLRAIAAVLTAGLLYLSGAVSPVQAADPIKVGVGLAQSGAGAPAGKMLLAALEMWRDDVNAKGGLLGRQIELISYDDQSNPANVPGIYTKLITVDKVDLLLGPYGTNFVAPAMPTIMQNNKMTISFTAIGINRHFNYPKYFSMVPVGPDGVNAFSKGFFDGGGGAESQAADRRDPRRRRRIRPKARPTARAKNSRSTASRSSTTRAIRRTPPISLRSCVPCRRPIRISSTSEPIRRTASASCARRMKSVSRRRCSAAR